MFKEIFYLAGENKNKLRFLFFKMAILGILKIIPILILYNIIITFLEYNVDLVKIIILTVYLVLTYIALNAYTQYIAFNSMKLGSQISFDIRMKQGDKLRKLSLGYFVKKPTGEINTIMSEYNSRIEMFISFQAPFYFLYLVSSAGIMIFFFILDWRMALAAVSAFLLALLAYKYADRIAQKVTKAREESLKKVNSLIVEFIQGMPVIKVFNQSAFKFKKFRETMKDFREKNIKTIVSTTIPTMILLTFISFSIALILPVGLHLFFIGALTLNILILFIILVPSYNDSLSNFLVGYMHFKHSVEIALTQTCEILNEKTLLEPEKDIKLENFNIEFNEVYFSYEEEPTLKQISLIIPEKSITALVGPSGSGKTTISYLLARFWDVNSGEIKIGGKNIREIKTDQLLSYISIVFQDTFLFNETIMENIKLGKIDASDEEIISAAKAARCHEFIIKLPNGYDTIISERGINLSEGEKQRISIARALLKNAPILILDEATAFIDPENENLIQEAINELIKDKTVLIIAHRLSTIKSVDQILVINKGMIVERGNHDALLNKNSLYQKLWNAHVTTRGWKL